MNIKTSTQNGEKGMGLQCEFSCCRKLSFSVIIYAEPCLKRRNTVKVTIFIMLKSDQKYTSYIEVLKSELVPAAGCTEPIAIAFAAAKAHSVLGKLPEKVVIYVSGNIIKKC